MLYVAETRSQLSGFSGASPTTGFLLLVYNSTPRVPKRPAASRSKPQAGSGKWNWGLAQRSSQPGVRVPGDLEFREVAANPGLSELLGSGILAY